MGYLEDELARLNQKLEDMDLVEAQMASQGYDLGDYDLASATNVYRQQKQAQEKMINEQERFRQRLEGYQERIGPETASLTNGTTIPDEPPTEDQRAISNVPLVKDRPGEIKPEPKVKASSKELQQLATTVVPRMQAVREALAEKYLEEHSGMKTQIEKIRNMKPEDKITYFQGLKKQPLLSEEGAQEVFERLAEKSEEGLTAAQIESQFRQDVAQSAGSFMQNYPDRAGAYDVWGKGERGKPEFDLGLRVMTYLLGPEARTERQVFEEVSKTQQQSKR